MLCPMHDSVAMVWVGIALLLTGSVVGALVLRGVKCPGWAVVGGVCAGIVLGPTIFGRVLPSEFEQMYVGGRALQRQIESLRVYQQTLPPDLVDDDSAIAEQLATLEAEHAVARWEHQQPMRIVALLVTGLVLLGAAAGPRGSSETRPQLVQTLTIGGWCALLPGGIVFVVLHLLLKFDLWVAMLAAAALAIGPWQHTKGDIEAADDAEIGGARLIHASGVVASLLALAATVFAAHQIAGTRGLLLTLPMYGLIVSWVIRRINARWFDMMLHFVLLPMLGACAASKLELFVHFVIWPVLLFVLLSGDGRWLGALLGALLLGGRRGLRTMRLVVGVMACGPTQLAVAVIAGHGELLDGPLLLAVVSGAVLIELLAPMRRGLAERIARTEAELEELEQE